MENNLQNEENNNSPIPGTPQYDEILASEYTENNYIMRVSFGKRLLAFLIDFAIIYAFQYFLFNAIFGNDPQFAEYKMFNFSQDPAVQKMQMLASVKQQQIGFVFAIIFFFMEIFLAASIGKLILGIRIGNLKGEYAETSTLALRSFLKLTIQLVAAINFFLAEPSMSVSMLTGLLGLCFMVGCFFALSEKRQALHDLIAKTAIYKSSDLKESI